MNPMTECCSRQCKTPYCPICGKENDPIISLMRHIVDGIQTAGEIGSSALDQWELWRDALQKLIKQAEDHSHDVNGCLKGTGAPRPQVGIFTDDGVLKGLQDQIADLRSTATVMSAALTVIHAAATTNIKDSATEPPAAVRERLLYVIGKDASKALGYTSEQVECS